MTFWTTTEIARLRRDYPTATIADLERNFGRRMCAIKAKAQQRGLSRRRNWMAIAQKHVPVIFGGRR